MSKEKIVAIMSNKELIFCGGGDYIPFLPTLWKKVGPMLWNLPRL